MGFNHVCYFRPNYSLSLSLGPTCFFVCKLYLLLEKILKNWVIQKKDANRPAETSSLHKFVKKITNGPQNRFRKYNPTINSSCDKIDRGRWGWVGGSAMVCMRVTGG